MEQKIVMIGLGVMGAPMAKNILSKGFDLACCDANEAALLPFREIAPVVSTRPAEAAAGRSIIITIVPTSDIVETVLFGEDGALNAADSPCLVIDMSTSSYKKTMQISERLASLGHKFIDAPVGRTPREAITGNLLVMAGGDAADIEMARGLFAAVGDTVIHVGPTGSGLKAKLVNNYMAMINNVVTGETLSFAHRVGLDIAAMATLMSTTAAGLGQLNTNYPKKVLADDLSPDFPISMAIKDLNMAIELADMFQQEPEFGMVARHLLEQADEAGMGALDQTAIMKHLLPTS